MLKWVPYALVRITFFYTVGILSAIYFDGFLSENQAFFGVVTTIALYGLLWIVAKKQTFSQLNLLFSIVGFSAAMFMGYYNLILANSSLKSNHIVNLSDMEAYQAQVIEPVHETDKTNRYLVEVKNGKFGKEWKSAQGKIYLYINNSDSTTLHYGDRVIVNGTPQLLTGPKNPDEFNYKRFLSFQTIYHSQFVKGSQIMLESTGHGSQFFDLAYTIRNWATEVLTRAIASPRERNIALALILGVKDGLDDEIKNAYSASGAMHVLAVSGLHVGIIYWLVMLLFGKMQSHKNGKWLLAVIALLVLWIYAAVTGFSPSVLRAVTMFSAVAVAKAMGRTTNIYNTLAASAFVLLTFNPYFIMSVGFQLSFLAVLGIVYIQPKVYSIYVTRHYLPDKIWAITSVAIAAQLATFALGLLYFHQFPTFFFLSNLVVIPGAFAILLSGLFLLMINFIPPLFNLVGILTEYIIYGINELVFLIMKIPNSQIKDVYITTSQTWLIMGCILMLFFLIQYRKTGYLYAALTCALVFSTIQWQRIYDNKKLNKVTFYAVNRHQAIDFITAGNSFLYTDSLLYTDEDKMRFHIKPNHLHSGVSNSQLIPKHNITGIESGFDIITNNGRDYLICTEKINKNLKLKAKTKFDYIILAKNFNGSLKWIEDNFEFERIILDGSLSTFRANLLKEEGNRLKINYYSVFHEGALEVYL